MSDLDSPLDHAFSLVSRRPQSSAASIIDLLLGSWMRINANSNSVLQQPSPIDRIPNELLTLIFELTCTENLLREVHRKEPDYEEPDYDTTPTNLSSSVLAYLPSLPTLAINAVCGRWRSLCLALPGLWSRLELYMSLQPDQPTVSDRFMATLQLYLERSANSPLFLCLTVLKDELSDNPPALDLLLQHTSHWKTFQCYTNLIMSKTPLFLPILEDLSFGCDHDAPPNVYDCFQAAPMLRTLSVEGFYTEEALLPELPKHRLRSLIMRSCSLHPELYWVLKTLHNLTNLELRVRACEEQPRNFSILLAQVRSFTLWIECHETDVGTDVGDNDWFRIFAFPSLHKFTVSRITNGGKAIWPARAFSDFLSRSSCLLTDLSIDSILISDLEFIAALRLLPSLTRLSFDDCHVCMTEWHYPQINWESLNSQVTNPITSLFLSKLTLHNSDSETVLVPKLQSLTIKLICASFNDASFVEMVLSRWIPDHSYAAAIGIASLRSLVLRLHGQTVDEDVYRPLFELDKVGMRWGREVKEEAELRPLENLERMGMRVVITGKEYRTSVVDAWSCV